MIPISTSDAVVYSWVFADMNSPTQVPGSCPSDLQLVSTHRHNICVSSCFAGAPRVSEWSHAAKCGCVLTDASWSKLRLPIGPCQILLLSIISDLSLPPTSEVARRALSLLSQHALRRAAALREAMQGHLPFVTPSAGARPWARRDYCDSSQRSSVGPAIEFRSLPPCLWGLQMLSRFCAAVVLRTRLAPH